MAMQFRELGKTGVKAPAIGFGCMGMSEFYSSSDEAENLKVLHMPLTLVAPSGIPLASILNECLHVQNHVIMTCSNLDMYGCGHNEELIGKILKTQRDKVFICTNGKPEYVRQQCELSLKRLNVDVIDLYYQHRVDPNTPIEKTITAMAKLVKEGKVRYLGMSECSAETLRRAYKVHPIAAVQMEYCPWTLDIEKNGLLDAAKELAVTVVAYSPLGCGENFAKNLELVKKLEDIAAKKGVTASELTLAWVIAQGFIAIPGTRKIKYLDSNFSAAKLQLTPEEIQEIRAIS
ncbi:hypothetical protein Unana1_08462 [Umbelopsis nana]